MQKWKAEENAKRNALRSKINVALPLAFGLSFATAVFFGEDNTKEFVKQFGGSDPLGNAPGIEQGRQLKKDSQARSAEYRAEIMGKVTGNEAPAQ